MHSCRGEQHTAGSSSSRASCRQSELATAYKAAQRLVWTVKCGLLKDARGLVCSSMHSAHLPDASVHIPLSLEHWLGARSAGSMSFKPRAL